MKWAKGSEMNEQEAKREIVQAKEELLEAKAKLKELSAKLKDLWEVMNETIAAARGGSDECRYIPSHSDSPLLYSSDGPIDDGVRGDSGKGHRSPPQTGKTGGTDLETDGRARHGHRHRL
jgi:hypothetical protein